MATENNVNAKVFCEFLSCLLADMPQRLFL